MVSAWQSHNEIFWEYWYLKIFLYIQQSKKYNSIKVLIGKNIHSTHVCYITVIFDFTHAPIICNKVSNYLTVSLQEIKVQTIFDTTGKRTESTLYKNSIFNQLFTKKLQNSNFNKLYILQIPHRYNTHTSANFGGHLRTVKRFTCHARFGRLLIAIVNYTAA